MNRTFLRLRRLVLSVLWITLGCNALKAEVVITAETETSIRIADIIDIAFEGDFRTGALLVNYADGTTVSTPIASIRKITFLPDEDLTAVATTKDVPTVSVCGNLLLIHSQGGSMTVCDAAGRKVAGTALGKGLTTFSLEGLPNAVYVLNVNGHTVKFLKK